ncbi:OmpA family protein [Nisaea sediminum]|uniref:OmpA family protein n=1 Tax=Nisaea sediminum TaxID=2775867 RepID=UPI0018686413|nr:OmpA family protein [Nisaea sediminum]
MPDALNPVEWYEKSTEAVGSWFEEDDSAKTGDTGTYPNVASVPDKPAPNTSSADRAAIREQLVADRENAQYDDSKVAPVVSDAAAQPSVPAAAPVEPEPIKPVRMTSTDEATRQIAPPPAATTTSQVAQTASRSSLWPNAPAPTSAGDRAVTNAQVGDPVTRTGSPVAPSDMVSQRAVRSASRSEPATTETASDISSPQQPVQAEAPQAEAAQVASVPAPAEPVSEPVQAPLPQAGSDSVALTPPPSGDFNFGDPSVIVDESALPGAFVDYQGGQGGSYQAGVIRFSNGSANLSSADQGVIRELVPLIRDYNATVEIVGHASSRTRNMDPFEHKLVNFEMSLQRANAVAEALINAGAPSERISVLAVGDSQPLSSEAMPAGEAENRRAEIYLIY